MKTMQAKFRSVCPCCSKPINKGDSIQYDPRQRKAWHLACKPAVAEESGPDITDLLYEDQCAAACGFGL